MVQDYVLPNVEEVYNRAQLVEERRGDGYIELMVDVYMIVLANQHQIIRRSLYDFVELCTDQSNTLYFRIPYKESTYALPFDVEFVITLDRDLMLALYEQLQQDQKAMSLRNRRVLVLIKKFLVSPKATFFEDMNVFEEVTRAREQAQTTIEAAKKFRLKKSQELGAQLRLVIEGYFLPANTHFRLLLARSFLAQGKTCLFHDEVKRFLWNSYYKGSEDAFNQNLNQLFLELSQVSELLSSHADSVLDNPMARKAQRHGSQMAWYRYEALDDDEDAYDQCFTAASRQWLALQLYNMARIKRDWHADRFRSQLTRLTAEKNLTDLSFEALTRLFLAVLDKMESSAQSRSIVFASNHAETRLGFQNQQQAEENKRWIWSNRLALLELAQDIFSTIQLAADKNPSLQMPQALNDAFQLYQELCQDPNRRAYQEHQQGVEAVNLRALEEKINLAQELDDDDQATQMDELLSVHQEMQKHLQTLVNRDPSWFARLWAAFPSPEAILDSQKKIQDLSLELSNLLETVEREVVELYESIHNFSEFESGVLDIALEMVNVYRMRHFVKLDFAQLDPLRFQEKFNHRKEEKDVEEQLLKLEQLLGELRAMPATEDLDGTLKPWSKQLPRDEQANIRNSIESRRAKLDELQVQIRERMLQLLNDGSCGTSRIRMEAFGFMVDSEVLLRKELNWMVSEIAYIGSIKGGRGPASRFSMLQERILAAQGNCAKTMARLRENSGEGISNRVLDLLEKDLHQNSEALSKLKKETDGSLKKVRMEQGRFGRKENLDHLDQNLMGNDVADIARNYHLRDGLKHEVYQRVAQAFQQRKTINSHCFEQLMADKSTPDEDITQELRELFTKKDYDSYKKGGITSQLKLAMINTFEALFEAEAMLLIQVLNFGQRDQLLETATCAKFLSLFSLISQPDPVHHRQLKRLKGRISTQLHRYTPIYEAESYKANRDTFLQGIIREVGTKLD